MLRIRQEQVDAFQVSVDRDFARWAVPHLRAAAPEETAALSDRQLLDLASAAAGRARAHGATDSQALYEYMRLAVRHGLHFDERDAFRAHFAAERDGNVAILTAASVEG